MQVTKITVSRAVKINTGNYENTDVGITLEASVQQDESVLNAAKDLIALTEPILRDKIDDIELGKRKAQSKASRYGV
jgi:hypothetical protein